MYMLIKLKKLMLNPSFNNPCWVIFTSGTSLSMSILRSLWFNPSCRQFFMARACCCVVAHRCNLRLLDGICVKLSCIKRQSFDQENGFNLFPSATKNNFFVVPAYPLPSTRCVPLTSTSLCPLFYAVPTINLSNIKRKILGNAKN